MQDEKVPAITGTASDFATHWGLCPPEASQAQGHQCWLESRQTFWARLEPHRRRRFDHTPVSAAGEAAKLPEKRDVLHAEIGCHHLPLLPRNPASKSQAKIGAESDIAKARDIHRTRRIEPSLEDGPSYSFGLAVGGTSPLSRRYMAAAE